MAGHLEEEDLDQDVPAKLAALVQPHVESFDWFLEKGISEAVQQLDPMEVVHPVTKSTLRIWFENVTVWTPRRDYGTDTRVFPNECREGRTTYSGKLTADIFYQVDGGVASKFEGRKIGSVPIMLKSKACHLRHLTRRQLITKKEEALEVGGYFVVNGNEKLVRLLIVPRRNYIMALKRSAFLKRGPNYTDMGCQIRCARPDQTTMTNRVHYLTDGNVNVAFTLRRQEFFVPAAIMLKCLQETSDKEIYERLVSTGTSPLLAQRAELALRELRRYNLRTQAESLAFIGERFRVALDLPERLSHAEVGQKLLKDYILVHLERPADKFNMLLLMMQKLYALVDGACSPDNADNLQHHEILLPGHLFNMHLKEQLQIYLQRVKAQVQKEIRDPKMAPKVDFQDSSWLRKALDKGSVDIGQRLNYFLSTGNLVSPSGLDLSQTSGYVIGAERLNFFRFISHFRSVHRGAYFSTLRTTTVRKLLPEAWGFLCPVHTPDGSPCGLLNHLTMPCKVVTGLEGSEASTSQTAITRVLAEWGILPAAPALILPAPPSYLPVVLDGRVVGSMKAESLSTVVDKLRRTKVEGVRGIPSDMEVAHIPYLEGGTFAGLFLFTQAARLVRPVRQLAVAGKAGDTELIGTLEQGYMDIRCPDGGAGGGTVATHEELHPTAMLSVVASLTPWSDYNQSPRNMYQCQMGKQTMGVPFHAFGHKGDSKTYRLQTPQTPIARTVSYAPYRMDDYPTGCNAVVAVLAYTGYDMEDAMIINKSSMERGFGHATVYKREITDLTKFRTRGQPITEVFGRHQKRFQQHQTSKFIDHDGLPYIGQPVQPGEPYLSTISRVNKQGKTSNLKGSEKAVIDKVTLIGNSGPQGEELQQVSVLMRLNRNPVIGDKFSSRHGQKGVLSQLWPDVDMPFAGNTGMRPDVIINPHAFPSRMTIGMLVESMAAKAGALHGTFVDATPFKSSTLKKGSKMISPVDEFGKQLREKGFNYLGSEVMYSGVLGTELKAEIYMGVVYYQRLRHMVSDKFQVRSTGPVNQLTRQPVKGRKVGGGIRFGEMERDSLLAHGAAYLLHDRLHTCSDYHTQDVCSICGSLLSPHVIARGAPPGMTGSDVNSLRKKKVTCGVCNTGQGIVRVAMPFVFKYLASELASMNIKIKLKLKD